MKQQLKDNWVSATQDANWNLASGAADRDAADTLAHRVEFMGQIASKMQNQRDVWLRAASGLSATVNVMKNGFWSLTKEVVRTELAAGRNTGLDGNVYITGHSGGGARAAMVSMWLEKDDSTAFPTYTFGAPGVQCAVRYSLPTVYSADMDVLSRHNNIKQYTHALDVIGRMDYHPGKVCLFGKGKGELDFIINSQNFVCLREPSVSYAFDIKY
jgi:hypothetical protein